MGDKTCRMHLLIITDRTELDEQNEKVLKVVNEEIYRTYGGADAAHLKPSVT